MTITLPMPEKDNQPPPPNPLNVLNLLLSKLKAMETSEVSGEITEVDVELCNKIYCILNPAAASPLEVAGPQQNNEEGASLGSGEISFSVEIPINQNKEETIEGTLETAPDSEVLSTETVEDESVSTVEAAA